MANISWKGTINCDVCMFSKVKWANSVLFGSLTIILHCAWMYLNQIWRTSTLDYPQLVDQQLTQILPL